MVHPEAALWCLGTLLNISYCTAHVSQSLSRDSDVGVREGRRELAEGLPEVLRRASTAGGLANDTTQQLLSSRLIRNYCCPVLPFKLYIKNCCCECGTMAWLQMTSYSTAKTGTAGGQSWPRHVAARLPHALQFAKKIHARQLCSNF